MSLNPLRRQDILHATLSLVAADGFDAVTMDAIAAASQSSKATLYRHWTSKANLVTEAVTTIPPRASDIADTGSLRTDLHEFIRQGFQRFDDISRLALALGHAASRHPELGRSLRENVVGAEDFGFEQLLRRAIGRGEVPADHPGLPYAPILLISIVELAPSLGLARLSEADFHDYIDHVVLPVLTTRT